MSLNGSHWLSSSIRTDLRAVKERVCFHSIEYVAELPPLEQLFKSVTHILLIFRIDE